MNGYLIAEEGPLAGTTVAFEEAEEDNEWVLGRDPDSSDIALEDPMVSRRHALIRYTSEGFILENLSTVNPATQNGMVIAEPVLLKEGDILQIGSTFFHFTEKIPEQPQIPAEEVALEEETPTEEEGAPPAEMTGDLHFGPHPETRWLLKVISGPNAGAEFAMHKSSNYLIGKDPNICDIVFQDLSVSRQHARLSIDESENAFIEDLGSRNGIIVNGELISEKQLLSSQDLVALGTTTFLVIDRHEARETIISPAISMPKVPSVTPAEEAAAKLREKRDWKEIIIPKKHLIFAGLFGVLLFGGVFAMLSLFKTEPIIVKQVDEQGKIEELLAKFPGVEFSYNHPSGKLFLIGHVTTNVEYQEMKYLLGEVPFIHDIEDTVIVDELVWQNMNELLSTNPNWTGVSMYSPKPGVFVLRGYLETLEQAESLSDYIHQNFDYLQLLENHVVVEKNLEMEIESLLLEKEFSAITFEVRNGEVVLSGRVDENRKRSFHSLIKDFKELPGVRVVKNYVAITSGDTSRIDLTKNYKITGYSKRDEKDFFVVINGRILGQGDLLDGMLISKINPKMVLLEKEGLQFKINYNMQ